jgi:hypothetical protein
MPRVGFESTIPESERAKTVHALDRSGYRERQPEVKNTQILEM